MMFGTALILANVNYIHGNVKKDIVCTLPFVCVFVLVRVFYKNYKRANVGIIHIIS